MKEKDEEVSNTLELNLNSDAFKQPEHHDYEDKDGVNLD